MLLKFDPVSLSIEENKWLLRHLGEPWSIASRDIHPVPLVQPHRKDTNPYHYPDGVVPGAVRPIIDRVYELLDLEKHHGEHWVGIAAIEAAIRVYITQAEKWQADKRKGAPRFPSMYSYDSKGRPHRAGPGSDSGRVQTYFGPDGSRLPFMIDLIPHDQSSWVADWAVKAAKQDQPVDGLFNNTAAARIECFCGHAEKYRHESRSSYNAARARMSRHLRKATEEVDRHREIHTAEFGGVNV